MPFKYKRATTRDRFLAIVDRMADVQMLNRMDARRLREGRAAVQALARELRRLAPKLSPRQRRGVLRTHAAYRRRSGPVQR